MVPPARLQQRPTSNFNLLTLTLTSIAILLVSPCSAHTFLTGPEPYNRKYLTESCTKSNSPGCYLACPPYRPYVSRVSNTPSNPAAVWKRGEKVNIQWARNQHEGGFIYLSLVPINSSLETALYSTALHDSLIFYSGCWSQGRFSCRGRQCGSDKNTGYSRQIKVPSVYRDGVYVFSLTWFGGVRRGFGHYPDYRSCSFIRIEGGKAVNDGSRGVPVKFKAGNDPKRNAQGNVCNAATNEPGQCGIVGCRPQRQYPAFNGVPKIFDGRKPGRLSAAKIDVARGDGTESSPSPTPSMSAMPTQSSSMSPAPSSMETQTATATATATASATVSASPSFSVQESVSTSPLSSVSQSPSISESSSASASATASFAPSMTTTATTMASPSMSVSFSSSIAPTVAPSMSPLVSASVPTQPSQSPDGRPQPPSNARCVPIGSRTVCCTKRCGGCYEAQCFRRPGGSRKCCPSVIRRSGVRCSDTNRAPCLL